MNEEELIQKRKDALARQALERGLLFVYGMDIQHRADGTVRIRLSHTHAEIVMPEESWRWFQRGAVKP